MATLINPHQPEDNTTSALQSDSSQSALELLKPDPPIDNDDSTENNAEEADLEALRQAALLSIRPKKSAFKVQAHPVRNNLLSIIPVEEDEEKKPEKKVVKSFFNSRQPPAAARDSPSKTNKFNRYDSDKDKSSESESEYEEIEEEEEVTATESETETEKTTTAASEENKKKLVKTQVSEADDVLNVDCSEEVDEFTNFLNEFEDDLKPKETAGQPKPKKTKKIMVKRRVKKEKPVKSSRNTNQTSRRTRSRSPGPLRSRRTPPRSPPLRRAYSPRGSSRYSPPPYYRGGRRNSRSPSPYYRRPRRYSRSPSPRRRSPRPFRSPRRGGGSPRRYGRTPTLSPEPQRGSLSPSVSRNKSPNRNTGKGSSNGASSTNNKSKSLPPSKAESNSQKKQQAELTEEEKAKQIADNKLKTLSSPERERLLQRRKKFESNLPIQTVGTKKISLKNKDNQHRFDEKSNIETNNSRDNNKKRSYPDDDGENNSEDDADDTLDKFEDEQRGTAKNRRQPKEKAPSKTNVTDLRVQLYKKRQKMQQQQKQAEPEMQEGQSEVDQEYPKTKFREIEPELDDYDDDRDSLEKAQLSSSEEEEFTHRNIQITSTNRIVKKPSKSPPKPKKRLIKEEMPLKKSAIRPTLMSRLGGKVPSEDEYSEEEEDLATSPLRFKSKASKSSDENSEKKKNKKEKKEKKKEKKEKKKSKKEKKSKKNQNNSSSENDGKDGGKVDEDDLFKYFENMDNENQFHGKNIDKEDILLEQMKKKNDKLVKRQQEIEKDRKLHS